MTLRFETTSQLLRAVESRQGLLDAPQHRQRHFAGFSVVLDARYPRRAQRQAALALADALGVPATILECVAPREVLEKRLRERSQDISDADADLLDHQMAETEPLTDEERERTLRIDSRTGLETLAQFW